MSDHQGIDSPSFGYKLRQLRVERNMSQGDLAKHLEVTPAAISQFETGARMPSWQGIVKFADIMEVTTDYLLGRTLDRNLPPEFLETENREVCQQYARLSVDARGIVRDMLDFLAWRTAKR